MVFFFEGRFCNTPLSELTVYPNERQQEADKNSITKLVGMIQLSQISGTASHGIITESATKNVARVQVPLEIREMWKLYTIYEEPRK